MTRHSEIADDETSTLADTKRALLSVVARNCHTGFKYFAIDHRIREGLADIDAGRTRRATVVTEELRKKTQHPRMSFEGLGKTLSHRISCLVRTIKASRQDFLPD